MKAQSDCSFTDIDAFISYAWGTDSQGRWTRERAAVLSDALRERGLSSWFNTGQIRDNMMATACEAIDRADIVVVCLTEQYVKRVNAEADDRCRIEFLYSLHSHSAKRIIPLV